jgi:hypothetical protein
LYQTIFRQSWQITKKHTVLWLFGFFVLFWGGKGLDLELFFSNAKTLGDGFSPLHPEFWEAGYWNTIFTTMSDNLFTGIGVLCMMMVFGCFVLFIIMSSQIALVDAFAIYQAKTPKDRYSLDHALKASSKHMLTVLAVNVLSKAVSYGLLAVASSPLLFANIAASKFVYTVFLYLIMMPVVVCISMLTKYAVNAAIIEELSISQAYKRGWEILSRNFGVSLEFALLALITFLGTNIVSIVFAALATMPFFFMGMLTSLVLGATIGIYFYLYLFYTLAVLTLVFTAAVFSAWHFGNWTLLFLELTKGSRRSKIHRLFVGETPVK